MTHGGAPGPGTASGLAGRDDRSELSAGQRAAALSRMAAESFDVIVVGGGVTGCGIALDAASRGLSVALAEMDDYASGTSSRSGKLIHGGLRYLEQLNFGLVREALRERDLMLRHLCPHLVKPVRFIYPLAHRVWERGYVGAGVALYDAFGGAKAVPRHRHLTRRGALDVAPALEGAHLAGAITFFDAQVDDARHTLTLARTAAAHGAVLASSAKVTGLLRTGERVSGVRLRDMETGVELGVRGRHVIGAAGAWTGEIQEMLPEHDGFQVRASKGVHILVPRERIRSKAAILVRAEDSVLFIRPWGRHWLIGTTDTPWDADPSSPVAAPADIAYLLRNVNRVVSPPITVDDITGVFAGLRPLLSGGPGATSRLTREHAVASPAPGLTVIGGGKYTTYRVMARDAVDAALGAAGTEKLRPVPPSGTEDIALLGADGYPELWNSRHRLAERAGLPGDRIERLLNRYGSRTGDLLAAIERQPSLADPIPGAEDYLKAEARYAVSHEGALHLDDILARRLHAASEQPDGGVRAAECVAPLAGEVLGWSGATVTAEIERYRTWVTAERAAMRGGADAGAVRR
jgi:glycerol-3-phosphate dehydrogenase